jgi:hypothetical protein
MEALLTWTEHWNIAIAVAQIAVEFAEGRLRGLVG